MISEKRIMLKIKLKFQFISNALSFFRVFEDRIVTELPKEWEKEGETFVYVFFQRAKYLIQYFAELLHNESR